MAESRGPTAAELKVKVGVESDKAESALDRFSSKVKNIASMAIDSTRSKKAMENIKESTDGASRSLESFAVQQQRLRIEDLTQKLAVQERQFGMLVNRLNDTRASYGVNSDAVNRAEIAYDKMAISMETNTKKLDLMKQKLQETISKEKALADQTKQTTDFSERFGKALDKLGGATTQVVIGALRELGAIITNQVLNGFQAAIGLAADYERNLNLLEAQSNATAAQTEALGNKAKELGSDMSLPGTSAGDAAAAMLELSKAGLDVTNTMDAAKGVLQLSAAAQIDNAKAAVLVGDALNMFSLKGTEATRVADLLAGVASSASGSIEDAGYAMQQAGSVFAAANVPIEDTATLIALLAKNGIKGSDAGTSLKTMMQRLQSPTAAARKEIEGLGVSIYDSSGTMRPMIDIIGDFESGLSGLSEQQRANALNTIFGSDAVRAASIVFKEGAEGFDGMAESVTRSGIAGRMSEAQMKGLSGAVEGLKSQTETLLVNAMEPLLPTLTNLVTKLADFAGWLADRAGPAAEDFVRGLQLVYDTGVQVSRWLSDNAAPAIATFAGALLLVNMGSLHSAAIGMIALAPKFVGGMATMTASMIAFAAQAAIVAGALYLVYKAGEVFQDTSDKIANAQNEFLNGFEWWREGANALAEYTNAGGFASAESEKLKTELEQQRQVMWELTTQYTMGTLSEGEYIAAMQDHKIKLKELTTEVTESNATDKARLKNLQDIRAEERGASRSATDLTGALQEQSETVQLLPEQLEEYNKALERVMENGPKAFGDLVNSSATFQKTLQENIAEFNNESAKINADLADGATTSQAKSLNDRLADLTTAHGEEQQALAENYAIQQQMHRQHLGALLIDYANTQLMMHQDDPEYLARHNKFIDMIAEQYGILPDAATMGFGDMMATMDAYLEDGTLTLDETKLKLAEVEQKYLDMATASDELRGEVITEMKLKFESNGYSDDPAENMRLYMEDLQKAEVEVQTRVRMEAAQAQAQGVIVKNMLDGLDGFTSVINIDGNDAIVEAGTINREIGKIPAAYYVDIDDNTKEARERITNYRLDMAKIEGEKTTTLTVNGIAEALGVARTGGDEVGAGFADGIAAGIAAAQARVSGAAITAIQSAITSAKNAAVIRSPSGKSRDEIGIPLAQGIAVGIVQASGEIGRAMAGLFDGNFTTEAAKNAADAVSSITDAMSSGVEAFTSLKTIKGPLPTEGLNLVMEMIGISVRAFADMGSQYSAELLEATSNFAQVAGEAVDLIGSAVEAFNALNSFEAPTRDTLLKFSYTLRDIVADFWHRAQEVEYALDSSTLLFSATAKSAVETIGIGVESLKGLNDFQNPSRESLLNFSYTLRDVVVDFWHRAQESHFALDESTTLFADTAKTAVETIASGVESLTLLNDFEAPSREALLDFSLVLRDVVVDFWHRAQEVEYALDESTLLFAETAHAAVGTIADGVTGLMALNEFQAPSRDAIWSFSMSIKDTVGLFAIAAQAFEGDALTHTSAFAESAANVVGVIAEGVEGFLALAAFRGVPQAALQQFMADLEVTIRLMQDMSTRFDLEGMEATAAFADSVSTILSPISEGVDAFSSLTEYTGVIPDTLYRLMLDMELAVQLMTQLSARADKEGVEAAALFSSSLGKVFDGIKSGVDVMDSIKEYEAIPQERMDALYNDFMRAVALVQQLATTALSIESEGVVWRSALERFTADIKRGIDAVASLNGMNISIDASISASKTSGGSSSGNSANGDQSAPPAFSFASMGRSEQQAQAAPQTAARGEPQSASIVSRAAPGDDKGGDIYITIENLYAYDENSYQQLLDRIDHDMKARRG